MSSKEKVKAARRYVGNGGPLVSAHPVERELLREQCETVIVGPSVCARFGRMHIPRLADGECEDPLCEFRGNEDTLRDRAKVKPVDVYPPGYKEWCCYCVAAWRRGEREEGDQDD